mgnify:FL=1
MKILVADDEKNMLWALTNVLSKQGFKTFTARDGEEAIHQFKKHLPDVVLLDLKMPKKNGIEVLKKIKKINDSIPVIMITAHGNIETAIEAMKLGAFDYVQKPFEMEEINVLIKKALKIRDLTMEVELLRDELSRISRGNQIIGESPQIKEVMDLVNRVAKSNATVLILGESGTGKELVANAIHYNSDRKNKPFVKVNCGALPENLLESELFGHEKGAFTGAISRKIGRFERAHGGSIFLDEIGEMSFSTQVKLLRVLQEKQIERVGSTEVIDVDVRIIAATNKDLKRLVEEGRFREDLYYRLNVIPIKIPPLRERKQDIPLLVKYFLQKYSLETGRRGMTISDSALDKLKTYSWPGNIRELQNVIERAVILSPGREITEDQLPPEIVKRDRQVELDEFKLPKNGVNLNDLEKSLIKQALDMTNDNQTEAARLLGITRHTLIYRMEKYGLKDRN